MKISGTNLSMIRGDSECIKVTCDPAFSAGDAVAMQVRESADDETAFITKEVTDFPDGAAYISLLPEDTAELEAGRYVYDIDVRWANGMKKTIVEKSSFTIREDVTRVD